MGQDARVDDYVRKSERWPSEITALRPVLLSCGLTEQIKWSKPCYSHAGRNIVIIQEMKAFLSLMFFRGAVLADPDGVLEEQGPNSRSARRICFRSVDDVTRLTATIRDLVVEAIDVEDRGIEVAPSPEVSLVPELIERLAADPILRTAFERLTPGRRREYNLYVGSAKQATTRHNRITKHRERILAGKGMRDR